MKKNENKLPKLFKKQWIKSLTNGNFQQGRRQLWNKSNNTFCCLGVAGKLLGVSSLSCPNNYGFLTKINTNMRGLTKVPDCIKGTDRENSIVNTLATMNDSGKSFKEIANWIEINL